MSLEDVVMPHAETSNDVLDVKSDAVMVLIRQVLHEQRNFRMEMQGVYSTVNKVQLATERMEAQNPIAATGIVDAKVIALEARVLVLEQDRTKRVGVSEFGKYMVQMWPMFALLAWMIYMYVQQKGIP